MGHQTLLGGNLHLCSQRAVSTAQHSTAQHSTAQHSTAQHRTLDNQQAQSACVGSNQLLPLYQLVSLLLSNFTTLVRQDQLFQILPELVID